MSTLAPIITFKAGICDVDQSSKPYKIKPKPTPGYVYLYSDEDFIHFCWRPRNVPLNEPELDLLMIPTDGTFIPYDVRTPSEPSSKTNGRIFALKFGSSSQRYLFWLQSKSQARSGDPSWLSPRDLKIGEIVDRLLQGEEVDVTRELAQVPHNNDDSQGDGDDDEPMEDVEGHGDPNEHYYGSTGGAGHDATGGDIRREGEDAREGGADGARAASSSATDAATAVRNFLESLRGPQGLPGNNQAQGKGYPLLTDLLEPSTTIPMISNASEEYVNNLLNFLPAEILAMTQQGNDGDAVLDPSSEVIVAAREAMSSDQKQSLLKKVLRSPQFTQSLASLTIALREGGLPTIAEALGIKVENGGLMRGGSMPLGGGEAVEVFVEGVKKTVQQGKK